MKIRIVLATLILLALGRCSERPLVDWDSAEGYYGPEEDVSD